MPRAKTNAPKGVSARAWNTYGGHANEDLLRTLASFNERMQKALADLDGFEAREYLRNDIHRSREILEVLESRWEAHLDEEDKKKGP